MRELDELTDQIPDTNEQHQGKLFNEALVKMMELLENSIKIKDSETQFLKENNRVCNADYTQKLDGLNNKISKVKRIRVTNQREICDLERKLQAMNIDPEETSGPIPEAT